MVQTEQAIIQIMEYQKLSMISRKIIIFFIVITSIFILVSIQNSYADNTIKQIIKIEGIYPADSASADFTIDPPLTNTSKTMTFLSFSHTGEEDHSDTFRSWEVIDNSTLRIYGENTATGNIAEEFIAYIVEYEGDIDVQHLIRTTTASESEGEKSNTIPTSINTTNSFIINKGHNHNADETTIGSEEYERIRIIDSTNWGWFVFDTPNSGDQENRVDVTDWNQDDIFVQRGLATFTTAGSSLTITPPTAVVRDRTILLVSNSCGDINCDLTEGVNDMLWSATLNTDSPPKIVLTKQGTSGEDINFAWELVEFPADFINVQYDSVTMSGGTLTTTDTIATPVIDFDKSIAISTVSTPFGWGGGSTSSGIGGAIDRGMVDIHLDDNNIVQVERGDSTGTNIIEYMVIEFLEPVFPENAQGGNTLLQIVKIEDTFTAGNSFQDYVISPALTNINKTTIIFSMNSTNVGDGDSSTYTKSVEIIDEDTFRVWGSGTATNLGADFLATIIEYTGSSPVFTQYDQLQESESLADTTRTMAISPVNTTGSIFRIMGSTMEDGDPTFGAEEFARTTLASSTSWTKETDLAQDDTETVTRVQVTDFNSNAIFVQRGTGSLAGTTTSISPPIDVNRTDSVLTVNFMTSSNVLGEDPADTGISATLDGSIPTDIDIERNTAGSAIEFAWEIITFPPNSITVQHGIHSQSGGTANATSTITPVSDIDRALAIGTVESFCCRTMGSGNSTTVNDFDSIAGKIELETVDTVRFVRGDDNGSWNVGFQIVEFGGGATFNQTVTDTTTVTDNVDLTINKTAVDFSSVVDVSTNKNITKVGSDLVSVTDVVIPLAVFVVTLNDTGTTVDIVNLNITKQQSEVASILEDINLNTTKIFLDSAVFVDSTTLTRDRELNETDTVSPFDNLNLDITKLVQDVTTVNDSVLIMRFIDLNITDTVIVNDPSIQFIISSIVPAGTGSGGGSTTGTSGLPTLQRLVGLSIISELFHVKAGDVVPSDFIIQTFGQESEEVSLINIKPEDAYISWFQYSPFPDTIEFDTTIDNSRQFSDPTRFRNKALDDFVLTVPTIQCKDLSVFDQPAPCIEKKIYEAPMIFTFEKGGLEFREKHIVTIDATDIIRCDYQCEFVNFITLNWWWLAGILVAFVAMHYAINAVRGKKVRVVSRIDRNYFTSFDANKPRKKFKRGKR